ncbi:hypothetical protein Bbelb_057340 [Branchiostoma belcheri]|nr:hypothetical protein Bbelb_057340 [Branchiostoma belcheri]
MSQLRLCCVVFLAVLVAVNGTAWEKENYPNPQLQPELCSPIVKKPSWLCNPDHVLNEQSGREALMCFPTVLLRHRHMCGMSPEYLALLPGYIECRPVGCLSSAGFVKWPKVLASSVCAALPSADEPNVSVTGTRICPPAEGDPLLLREKLKLVHAEAKCFCDDCTDRGGYTISVAAMQQMEPMYWTLLPTEQVPVNISSRRFTRYLRDTWFPDESCTDHVIILVSKLDDLVLISPGEFAKAILPDEKLKSIMKKAEHFFNVTGHYQPRLGLEIMITEIAETFDSLERAQSFILSGYMIAIIVGVVALYCTVGFICCRTYASMKKADRKYTGHETPFFFMQAQTSDLDDRDYDPKYDGVKGEEYEMRPYNDQAAPMPYWYGAPRGATASLPPTPRPGRSVSGRASTLGTASVPASPMTGVRGNPLYKPRSYTIQPSPSLGRESTVYPVRPLGSAVSGANSESSIPPSSGSTRNGINDNNNPYVLCFESTI